MRRFYDTTAPTKEGLLGTTRLCRICKNKPVAGAPYPSTRPAESGLGIVGFHLYGEATFEVAERHAGAVLLLLLA
jgi:hypothetical protein